MNTIMILFVHLRPGIEEQNSWVQAVQQHKGLWDQKSMLVSWKSTYPVPFLIWMCQNRAGLTSYSFIFPVKVIFRHITRTR